MFLVPYSTGFAFPPLTRWVKRLIVALLTAFVVELVLMNFFDTPVFGLLALSTSTLGPQTFWQIFTYVLVDDPSGVISMLVGLLFIWLIVSPFELAFGPVRTLQLFAVGIISASIPAAIIGLFGPLFPSAPNVLFGSFPISYAAIAALAIMARGRRLSFFGVWSMTAKQLLLLMAGLSLLIFLATKNLAMLIGSLGSLGGGGWFAMWINRPNPRVKPRRSGSWLKSIKGGREDESGPPKWIN